MITSNMDNWDDLNHLDTELSSFSYLNNWDDHVKFEVIIQKRFQTTEIIGMIKDYPRNHHFYYSNRGEIQPGHLWSIR